MLLPVQKKCSVLRKFHFYNTQSMEICRTVPKLMQSEISTLVKKCKLYMLNVRLAGDHLYGKLLFTWLSLVMSMMVSFCAVFFPRGVLDEILNLIESVSEGFPSYFFMTII